MTSQEAPEDPGLFFRAGENAFFPVEASEAKKPVFIEIKHFDDRVPHSPVQHASFPCHLYLSSRKLILKNFLARAVRSALSEHLYSIED
jgi:hypothetical protein